MGQFVDGSCIGLNKAVAVKQMCESFNENHTTSIYTHGIYNDDSFTNNIVFSCFDNMDARKLMYSKWVDHLKANPGERKESVFIDGRLLAEQYQIFTIQGDDFNSVMKYYQFLFEDDEVEEAECTFKQTSHVAAMIASNMVSVFNNWISNKVLDMPLRNVPFYQEHFTPAFYSQIDMV